MKIFDVYIFGIHIAPSYYWLAYALAFVIWYLILKKRRFLDEIMLDTLVLYIFFWVIIWWRLWYVLFYDLQYYIANPADILMTWKWWMSFHWWALWVIISLIVFSKRHKVEFLRLSDEIVKVLPIWLFLWRMWNYLNKELLWETYSWPLAVEKGGSMYFPSPLLEWFLEWIALFVILNYATKWWQRWKISWAFLFYYAIFRFFAEFFRTPDVQIWYIYSNWLTMWQILSIPMFLIWTYIYLIRKD